MDRRVLAIKRSMVIVMKRACPSAIDLSSSKMMLRSSTNEDMQMKL